MKRAVSANERARERGFTKNCLRELQLAKFDFHHKTTLLYRLFVLLEQLLEDLCIFADSELSLKDIFNKHFAKLKIHPRVAEI